jgi:hypothetical protein
MKLLNFELFDEESCDALSHVALEEEARSHFHWEQNPDREKIIENKMAAI